MTSDLLPRLWNALLLGALALVCWMAAASPAGAHPDERGSIGAVRYHETRWRPADIRDPAAAPSFSGYGVSRLDQRTAYWPVAGKVSLAARTLLPAWRTPERALNVLLFAFLVALCVRRGRDDPGLYLLAGLSPQVWYLFSYCTADAWDILLCILAYHETAFGGSLLWRSALGGDGAPEPLGAPLPDAARARGLRPAGRAAGIVLAGCLFGLLSLGKPTVLAAFLVAGVAVLRRLAALPAATVRRALPALAAAALVAAAWTGGAALSERIRYDGRLPEIRQEMAAARRGPAFVPDERGIVAWPSVGLRARGVPLADALLRRHPPFLPTTLASFAGSYGPMRFPSPRPWYGLVGLCWLLLGLCGARRFLEARPRRADVLAALALLAVPALLLGASAWHAWTADYQPQGRYLFPSNAAWAAFGALVPARRRPDGRPERLSAAVLTALLALGLLSFLLYAVVPLSDPAVMDPSYIPPAVRAGAAATP